MKENTPEKFQENTPLHDSGKNRASDESLNETIRGNVSHQRESTDVGSASNLDEKSSGMGRRDKATGLSTKDGLTGSDLDGQLTE